MRSPSEAYVVLPARPVRGARLVSVRPAKAPLGLLVKLPTLVTLAALSGLATSVSVAFLPPAGSLLVAVIFTAWSLVLSDYSADGRP